MLAKNFLFTLLCAHLFSPQMSQATSNATESILKPGASVGLKWDELQSSIVATGPTARVIKIGNCAVEVPVNPRNRRFMGGFGVIGQTDTKWPLNNENSANSLCAPVSRLVFTEEQMHFKSSVDASGWLNRYSRKTSIYKLEQNFIINIRHLPSRSQLNVSLIKICISNGDVLDLMNLNPQEAVIVGKSNFKTEDCALVSPEVESQTKTDWQTFWKEADDFYAKHKVNR